MSSSKPSGSKTKRKIADEHRNFQEKWELEYFCSEVKDKIICFICNNAISVPKLYNIKRHYGQHKSKYDTYEVSQESEAAVHASYVLSEMITKHSKPFTEGDFIKECLIKAAEIACPGSVKTFQAISLSQNTVVERVTDMARNLNDQIKENSSCFEAFSIACDESLSYYTEVRWLSCSKVLKQFWDLKEEICQFLITKNQDITLFSDQVWLQDFSFMVDITKHLSVLNLKLQGKDQIITNMCDQVNAFKCKLVLWEKQLKNEDLMHFPTCNMYKSSLGETASYQKYAEKNLSLRNEFETRFSDFKSLEGKFTLFSSIFSINIESVPNHMQMEVIDIQCDSDLKAKFIENETGKINLEGCISDDYLKVRDLLILECYCCLRPPQFLMMPIWKKTTNCAETKELQHSMENPPSMNESTSGRIPSLRLQNQGNATPGPEPHGHLQGDGMLQYFTTNQEVCLRDYINPAEGGKVNEFITALHSLAEHCNFGMLHDELIRNRIVVGVRDRALSERMQLDTDLTLVKATLMAKQLESVKEQQSSLYQQDSVDQIKKMPNHIKETKRHEPKIRQFKSNQLGGSSHGCTRCGNSNNHDWKNCPAMNSYCNKCMKKGHYAKVCRSEAINEIKSEIAFLGSVEDNSKKWIVPIKQLSSGGRGGQRGRLGSGGNRGCYNCGEEGHRKFECTKPARGGGRGRGQSRDGGSNNTCYNCGEEGHRKFECTKPAVVKMEDRRRTSASPRRLATPVGKSGDEEESSDNEEEETPQKRKQAEDSEEEEVEAEEPPKKKSKKPKSKKKEEDCYLTLQAYRTMPLESASVAFPIFDLRERSINEENPTSTSTWLSRKCKDDQEQETEEDCPTPTASSTRDGRMQRDNQDQDPEKSLPSMLLYLLYGFIYL
ncbi:hypothetical protein LAZ67_4003833 [Cordylochernes scorpioides]|uniref:CCHC-type domain-containing protein n=1 Tax=Cordylochernes scorpioides TaxID=51811 RepID=A0ABY6KH33_9ARAC|nr:hypothetical protein LAZ67_4003833 [Cordylochernes scorpioides]